MYEINRHLIVPAVNTVYEPDKFLERERGSGALFRRLKSSRCKSAESFVAAVRDKIYISTHTEAAQLSSYIHEKLLLLLPFTSISNECRLYFFSLQSLTTYSCRESIQARGHDQRRTSYFRNPRYVSQGKPITIEQISIQSPLMC